MYIQNRVKNTHTHTLSQTPFFQSSHPFPNSIYLVESKCLACTHIEMSYGMHGNMQVTVDHIKCLNKFIDIKLQFCH